MLKPKRRRHAGKTVLPINQTSAVPNEYIAAYAPKPRSETTTQDGSHQPPYPSTSSSEIFAITQPVSLSPPTPLPSPTIPALRDFSTLRMTTPHPWRSVRHRQRRMADTRFRPSPDLPHRPSRRISPPIPRGTPIFHLVTMHQPTPTIRTSDYRSRASQTTDARRVLTEASTQSITVSYSDVSTQTDPISIRPAQRPPAPDPGAKIDLRPFLVPPPTVPFPSVPITSQEYSHVDVPYQIGATVLSLLHPIPEPARSSYIPPSVVLSDIFSIVSPHYRRLQDIITDWSCIPPFQQHALLSLHRLLFPGSVSPWISLTCPYMLLPMKMVLCYLKEWRWMMERFVQDSGALAHYRVQDGMFVR